MRRKDNSVQTEFHSLFTAFLFDVDELYRSWGSELVITSGSESSTKHGFTSLHYATPAQAADIRTWETGTTPAPIEQQEKLREVAAKFCKSYALPANWIEIILEPHHIHIEYQPKRL